MFCYYLHADGLSVPVMVILEIVNGTSVTLLSATTNQRTQVSQSRRRDKSKCLQDGCPRVWEAKGAMIFFSAFVRHGPLFPNMPAWVAAHA
jgi:hypothetical protein